MVSSQWNSMDIEKHSGVARFAVSLWRLEFCLQMFQQVAESLLFTANLLSGSSPLFILLVFFSSYSDLFNTA